MPSLRTTITSYELWVDFDAITLTTTSDSRHLAVVAGEDYGDTVQ